MDSPERSSPGSLERARLLEAATREVPGVVDLFGGVFGEIATYGPGDQIRGIRVNRDSVKIHVVVEFGRPIPHVAREIRSRVLEALGSDIRSVDVIVRDVREKPAS